MIFKSLIYSVCPNALPSMPSTACLHVVVPIALSVSSLLPSDLKNVQVQMLHGGNEFFKRWPSVFEHLIKAT